MKNILLIISFYYFGFVNSQTIHDKTFNNIITIENGDVISNGKDFMLRYPIKAKKETLIILNKNSYLPAKTFFRKESFLAKQDKIILITRDWDYLKSIIESDKRTGYHSTPVTQKKLYQIDRVKNTVDSITIIEEYLKKPITYNFAKSYSRDSEPIYIEDCSKKNSLANKVNKYEKENNIIALDVIKQNGNCNILTFNYKNYDYQQRVFFLNLLLYLSNDKNKNHPKVFLPVKVYDNK